MLGASIFSRFVAAAGRFAGADKGNIAVHLRHRRGADPQLRGRGDRLYPRQHRPLRDAGGARLHRPDAVQGPLRRHHHDRPRSTPRRRPISPRSTPTTTPSRSRSPRPTRPAARQGLDHPGQRHPATITTDFMKVAGFPNINFNTSSTAAWGNVRMRVALVLDDTGSMADDGKMAAMQTGRQGPDRPAERARQDRRRHLHLDRSLRQGRQRRRQQLQRSPGSTGPTGMQDNRHAATGQGGGNARSLDADEPRHLDRLRHRPRPELRHQEHDAPTGNAFDPVFRPNSTTALP